MTKTIIKLSLTLIAVLAVAAGAIALYSRFTSRKNNIEVEKVRINEVTAMVQLCTMDIYNEVPVLDTINSKVIFAVQKQRGSISFDIENLDIDASGDTVRIVLPPEIVQLREATDDNSWQVIDTKYTGMLGRLRAPRISVNEENRIKAKLQRNSIRRLYADGTVAHARAEAVKNLEQMMEKLFRRPVLVEDPGPSPDFH